MERRLGAPNDDVGDDDASHSTCETFTSDEAESDNESLMEFLDDEGAPGEIFQRIESNDPTLRSLNIVPDHPFLSIDTWIAMGQNIGRNTHLKKLFISMDGVEEDDELRSPHNMDIFLFELADNRSIRRLQLEDIDFSDHGQVLRPFLIGNRSLVDLRLVDCNLGVRDVDGLVSAFSQRQSAAPIKTIEITNHTIDRETVRAVVNFANSCPRLKKLIMGDRVLGIHLQPGHVIELAPLLGNPNSSLKCLYVSTGEVGDDGVRVLANALQNNNVLQRLSLSAVRYAVTVEGWGHLLRVLCNASSINATYESNHTLERLDKQMVYVKSMGLPEDLSFCLKANVDSNAAREKIFRFHLNGDFSLAPFDEMGLELMPTTLGWIGKDWQRLSSHHHVLFRTMRRDISAFYRILRNFPDLFNFPSHEKKMRFRLESEVAQLRSDNAALTDRVEQLLLEIQELRGP